jgi:hypothetical protein
VLQAQEHSRRSRKPMGCKRQEASSDRPQCRLSRKQPFFHTTSAACWAQGDLAARSATIRLRRRSGVPPHPRHPEPCQCRPWRADLANSQ